jgi:RNA polymerase sigma factor (sigma-70 family)
LLIRRKQAQFRDPQKTLDNFEAMPSSNRPEDEKFKSWLLRIAVNEARMRRCKDRVQLYESLDDDSAEDEQDDFRPKQFADWRDLPSDALDREEFRKAVREAVAKLPGKYRVVFLLADAQSLSYEEIAATLNISVGNVKTRVHRARMKLQEHLTPAFKLRMSDPLAMLKGMNPCARKYWRNCPTSSTSRWSRNCGRPSRATCAIAAIAPRCWTARARCSSSRLTSAPSKFRLGSASACTTTWQNGSKSSSSDHVSL